MIILLCVCSMLGSALSIDVDYYLGVMRSAECRGRYNDECNRYCFGVPSVCHLRECYCHHDALNKLMGVQSIHGKTSGSKEEYETEAESDEIVEAPMLRSQDRDVIEEYENENENAPMARYDDDEDNEERPALRHHIAHFCPNLEIAANCIRKCIKRGKPAFCGKDHRCYCGHRYDSHDKDQPGKETAKYAEFKDLYQKYYGKKHSTRDEIVESKDIK